jgi:hypothetical protein
MALGHCMTTLKIAVSVWLQQHPIRYHVKVKAEANPFLSEYDQYFCNRTKQKASLAKESKQITMFMTSKNSNNSRVTLRRASLKSA